MEQDDKIKEEFEKYLERKNRKDEFDNGDGDTKSQIANEYVREFVPFEDKPEVIIALNKKYAGQGPFPNKGPNIEDEGKICSPNNIYCRVEKEIYLLKRLQAGEDEGKSNKRDILAEKLGLSTRTLSDEIQRLNYEHDLLGSTIEIGNLRHGKNTYDHTIHPVFLALNLTEIYFITVILPKLVKRSNQSIKDTALNIAGDIYRQLSEYAKEEINASISTAEKETLLKCRKGYRMEDEKGFLFYLKHMPKIKCKLKLKEKGMVSGTIWPTDDGQYKIKNEKTGETTIFNSCDIVSGPFPL